MKYLYILLFGLLSLTGFSQAEENENFRYHLFFNNNNDAPNFVQQGDYFVYQGTNRNLEDLFDNHPVVSFYQAFPNSISAANRKAYYLEIDGADMLQELETNFAGQVYYIERLNDIQLTSHFSSVVKESFKKPIVTRAPYDQSYMNSSDLLYAAPPFYPSDYGPTSPLPNTGVFKRSELDYMGAPEAWDIATGDGITIVISDSRINVDDTEFANKISFFEPDASQNQVFDGSTYHKHGTAVAGIALAQGNNGQGTLGVSYDSDVIMTNFQGLTALENFIELAKNGYRVFNMSWVHSWDGPNPHYEEKIDSLVNYYGAILIASASNKLSTQTANDFYSKEEVSGQNAWQASYTGEQVAWPASYDGVISVGNINHSWEINDPSAPSNMFWSNNTIQSGQSFVRDSYSGNVNITDIANPLGLIYNGYPRIVDRPDPGFNMQTISPLGIVTTTTNNEYVDILSATDLTMNYADYSYYQTVGYLNYGGTTSAAAPYVSGTAALMIDANGCLDGWEVDQIIKLTAKDIEHMPMNAPFFGKIGAGKLEIGKAVKFAYALKQPNGVARIKDHIFYRWDFNLEEIYNKLTMDNVQFIDDANVNFVARTSIDLIDDVLLEPNNGKSITLDIDPNMVPCTPYPAPIGLPGDDDDGKKNLNEEDKLGAYIAYPTLVDRQINITKKQLDAKQITRVMVFDIFSQLVFEKDNITQVDIVLELAGLSEGIYILKGYSNRGDELLTTKIVKK